jgi:hypothetical protein
MSSHIFSTFSVILLVSGHPEHLLSSTDTQLAFKCECHSKTAVRLKECSPKASQSISRVLVADLPSFTQYLMQDTLLDFAIYHRKNETRYQKRTRVKTMRVHTAVSRCRLMQ